MSNMNQDKSSDAIDPLSDYEPVEYPSEMERALAEEAVAAIQIRPCETISADATVESAVKQLNDSRVSSLLVVQGERLVGIFTERDVLERVAEQYDRHRQDPVSQFMTASPTIVYDCDQVAAAAAAISVAGHRHVPVLDLDEKVVGVVNPRRTFEFMQPYLD